MTRDVALARITAAACVGDPTREMRRSRRLPARAVEEALLQLHLFAGYPAMINALFAWRAIAGPTRASGRTRRLRTAGERVCRAVYGRGFEALMRNMRALHPVLPAWILEDGYGRVMHRPGLSLVTRKRLVVAALAALGAWRQLEPYLRVTPGARAILRGLRGVVPAARLRGYGAVLPS